MNAEDNNHHPAIVVVVRHGERQDYADRDRRKSNWVQGAKDFPELGHVPWDPPLTEGGREQALRVGQELFRRLQLAIGEGCIVPPVSAVFTSPLLRCQQTAGEIRKGVQAAPLHKDDEAPQPTSAAASSPTFGEGGRNDSIQRQGVDGIIFSCTASHVRVEDGLMESLNRDWYHSWALPGSDGTWGYELPSHQQQLLKVPDDLHPAACAPVQSFILGRWRSTANAAEVDLAYQSISRIATPYALHPPRFESRDEQQTRMRETLELMAQPRQTIVAVSHGGPVVHLYESVTGNPWDRHGPPSYCCFSVYRLTRRTDKKRGRQFDDGVDSRMMNVDKPEEWKYDWEALAVNQSII
jgi:broad specificity phosphatase PhoE